MAVNLAVVIAFALFAVIALTRTLVAAQDINHNVAVIIKPAVSNIDLSLKTLPVLDRVNSTAAQILTAAKPLSGQAGQVVNATQDIMSSAHSINGDVNSINADVHSIASDVNSVTAAVGSISPTVNTISGTVTGIAGSVGSIHDNVSAISGDTGSINSSARGISGSLTGVLSTAQDIKGQQTPGDLTGPAQDGVAGIDNRADKVIGQVGSGQANTIKADTAAIDSRVVAINGNATNICRSGLFQSNAVFSLLGIGPANCTT